MTFEYTDEIVIDFSRKTVRVSSTMFKGIKVYRLYFPNDTIEFLSAVEIDGENKWECNTIVNQSKRNQIRTIITQAWN